MKHMGHKRNARSGGPPLQLKKRDMKDKIWKHFNLPVIHHLCDLSLSKGTTDLRIKAK